MPAEGTERLPASLRLCAETPGESGMRRRPSFPACQLSPLLPGDPGSAKVFRGAGQGAGEPPCPSAQMALGVKGVGGRPKGRGGGEPGCRGTSRHLEAAAPGRESEVRNFQLCWDSLRRCFQGGRGGGKEPLLQVLSSSRPRPRVQPVARKQGFPQRPIPPTPTLLLSSPRNAHRRHSIRASRRGLGVAVPPLPPPAATRPGAPGARS